LLTAALGVIMAVVVVIVPSVMAVFVAPMF